TLDTPQTEAEAAVFRVLLVEDNPGDARLIQAILAGEPREPFTVAYRAERLSDGLRIAIENAPDLVLLDLTLPDSAGFETFEQFHAHAPHVPIIVLSGHDDEELALNTVHAGAQDYLVKGRFDAHLLVRAMRYAVERQRAEDALA